MASIIPGYNYDIFISYRQKDNKGDHWVSEFVEALKTELEATFKEEISVYFDINPHDGLLETHDVDASLKEKLKCLIFIPIISRTYCDPKSFAWEHEFKAFVEMASKDQFGLKVKLPNGNVGNRILPVRIHDLNKEDLKLYESASGSILRGVDFIYKASGVNRPLRSKEEKPGENLTRSLYLDQMNKVSHLIEELISGMSGNSDIIENETLPNNKQLVINPLNKVKTPIKKLTGRKIIYVFSVLVLLSIISLLINKRIHNTRYIDSAEILDKSINYYDFFHLWNNYHGKIICKNIRSDLSESKEIIEINTSDGTYYNSFIESDSIVAVFGIEKDQKYVRIDSRNADERLSIVYKRDSADIRMWRDQQLLHFGLLMELKSSGLKLEKNAVKANFNGEDCYELKFRQASTPPKNSFLSVAGGDASVYIDPDDYRMLGYTLKYGTSMMKVTCKGILQVNNLKMPQIKIYDSTTDNSLLWIDVFSRVE